MKTNLILLLSLLSFSVFGQGDAPPFVKGQSQATKSVASVIQVPNSQATKKSSSQTLIETGNRNRLINQGFENMIANTGWSTSLTGTANTSEAAVNPAFAGDKSYEVTCNGNASGGTCTFKQDVPTTFVTQASVSIYLKSSVASEDVKVYSRVNGVNTAQYIPTTNRGTADFSNYEIPVIAGTTSTGIAIEITAPPAGSAVITLDEGFVGYKDVLANTSVVGPWTTGTCISSHTMNTVTTCKYRQVGDSAEIQFKNTYSGTPNNVSLTFGLPNSWTIDTSKLTGTVTSFSILPSSSGNVSDTGVTVLPAIVSYNDTATVQVRYMTSTTGTNPQPINDSNLVNGTQPIAIGSTDTIEVSALLPISQLSASNNALSSTNGNTSWASCGHVAVNFTGFGTVTNIETQCKRDGDDLLMRGNFNSGVSTGIEARIALRFNGQTLTSSGISKIPSLQKAGEVARKTNDGSLYTLIEPSVSYITFSSSGSSSNGLTKSVGSAIEVDGNTVSLNARIPIAGWENSNVIVASLKDTPTTIGSSGSDFQSVYFGSGADCSTNCTTGFCSICGQVGNKITSVEWISSAIRRLNGINGKKYNCTGSGYTTTYVPLIHKKVASTTMYVSIEGPANSSANSVICVGLP